MHMNTHAIRRLFLRSIVFSALLLALPVRAEVELSEKVRSNFGISTVTASTVQLNRQWHATAQVLDGLTLVTGLADLRAAQATADASQAELQRLEQLYKADTNAALKNVEAARAQAIGDNGRVQTLQAQLISSWGAGIARMKANEREQLTQGLLAGTLVLVRAELINAPTAFTASTIRMKLLNDEATLNGKLIGALPQTNAQTLGKSYLISTQPTKEWELQAGQMLSVELQDATRTTSGIKLPRAAVLRWQGKQWAYIETAAGHYEREALTVSQWLDDAVLVSAGIKPGDKVVVSGAGLLLGAELKPANSDKEE